MNSKAFITVPANRGINISLLYAISENGIVGCTMVDGAFNGDRFLAFIDTVLASYFERHRNHVLVMDNCRFHHKAEVISAFNQRNIFYRFLQPYTPMLNLIEEFFGYLEAVYMSR